MIGGSEQRDEVEIGSIRQWADYRHIFTCAHVSLRRCRAAASVGDCGLFTKEQIDQSDSAWRELSHSAPQSHRGPGCCLSIPDVAGDGNEPLSACMIIAAAEHIRGARWRIGWKLPHTLSRTGACHDEGMTTWVDVCFGKCGLTVQTAG